jgi:AAT family amino acid transporter
MSERNKDDLHTISDGDALPDSELNTVENVEKNAATPHVVAEDRLARKLSARQVQMIAIGGTIGTGLFLGTGKSLATGGPASMLIAYLIVGGIVFVTMLSLGEMATYIPVAGSFCTYAG